MLNSDYHANVVFFNFYCERVTMLTLDSAEVTEVCGKDLKFGYSFMQEQKINKKKYVNNITSTK